LTFDDAWTAAAAADALSPHPEPWPAGPQLPPGGLRQHSASDQRLQRQRAITITAQCELAARDALVADIRALTHTDLRREAWLSTYGFSTQWVSA